MHMHFYFDSPAKLIFGSEKTNERNSLGNVPRFCKIGEAVALEEVL